MKIPSDFLSNSISVIVTTYNWPTCLRRVLLSIANQSCLPLEVIVADDGSKQETGDLIEHLKKSLPFDVNHIWQTDEGFQAAKIRNKALAVARGDYIIFLDGDCLIPVNFLAYHAKLAQTGYFVTGNRILLNKTFTEEILNNIDIKNNIKNPEKYNPENWNLVQWFMALCTKKIQRILPALRIPPFSVLNKLRCLQPNRWQGVKTCNLGVWRKDALMVNGFDESYTGWGFEDSDFVIRLQKADIKRKEGRFCVPIIHCWHTEQSRALAKENWQRLQALINNTITRANSGVDQYLNN